LKLREGAKMVMPGDNTTLDVELITPVPIEAGLRFNMHEGRRICMRMEGQFELELWVKGQLELEL
jgi:translation elongation factor EF-Tu-like GTPase